MDYFNFSHKIQNLPSNIYYYIIKYEYSNESYIDNKMKADELSIKGGFTMQFWTVFGSQIDNDNAICKVSFRRNSAFHMQNQNQYHQTIREMKNAQQMVLGMILYQYFDQFCSVDSTL